MARLSVFALACLLRGGAAQEGCPGGVCEAMEARAVHLLQGHAHKKVHVRDAGETEKHWECSRTVANPKDYMDCWSKGEFCCVDPKGEMYGSIMAPPDKDDPTAESAQIYPASRSYAWAGTSDDLETALKLRAEFGDSPETTFGIEVAVGFNPVMPYFAIGPDGSGFTWLVFQVQDSLRSEVFAPTFAAFFQKFSEKAKVSFSYDVVKEILVAYNTLGPREDAVDAWVKLTGCSRKCSAPDAAPDGLIRVSRECGCDEKVVSVYTALLEKFGSDSSPPDSSFKCIQTLFELTDNKPTAGQVRAGFAACEDMLPIFTGFGLGYNTIVSPLQRRCLLDCSYKPSERLAGREFVMPNYVLQKLAKPDFALIPLPPLEESNGAAILPSNATSKFCLQ